MMAVRSSMSATYKVHEFAQLSGVTVNSPWCNGPDFGMAVGVG
jgi:hypothetical protein